MNITELAERVNELAEQYPDAEVLLLTQPSWPLQFNLRGLVATDDLNNEDDEPSDPCPEHDTYHCAECLEAEREPTVIYLVEGGQPNHPYGPRDAFEAAW